MAAADVRPTQGRIEGGLENCRIRGPGIHAIAADRVAHVTGRVLPVSRRVFSEDNIKGQPSMDPLYVAVSPSNWSCTTRNLVWLAPAFDSSYVTREGGSFETVSSQ